MEPESKPETCPCDFSKATPGWPDGDPRDVQRLLMATFLRQYGDDLPEQVIAEAVLDEMLPRWHMRCSCEDPTEIVAAAYWKPSDWYLCTISGLAVKTELRGKGLGREAVRDVADKAAEDPRCLVLAADVTYDNERSKRSLRSAGFQDVSRFCFGESEKPTDIMHYIRYKPTDQQCAAP